MSETKEDQGAVEPNGMSSENESQSLERVGQLLGESILQVLEGIPSCSMRPTDISRKIGISRTIVSRTLSAIRKESPVEILTRLPGPESLRSIMLASKMTEAPDGALQTAMELITRLAEMIHEQYGTRAAFHAALSVKHSGTRDQFEQSSRYQVFNGMSNIFGIYSKVWLNCAIFARDEDDLDRNCITSIYGASGIRRLRPDNPINLPYGVGPMPVSGDHQTGRREFDLESFYANSPAPLTAYTENGEVIKTFAPDIGNKGLIYDMISAIFHPRAAPRIPPPQTVWRGLSVIPKLPSAMLNIDVLLHQNIFGNAEPEAIIYDSSMSGSTNFAEPKSKIKQLATNDLIEDMGYGISKLELSDVPNYREMITHICEECGHNPKEFRAYRYQIQYPIYGFQYVMGFRVNA